MSVPKLEEEVNKLNIGAADQKITPWEVEGAVVDGKPQDIDYEKLIKQFGTRPITQETLQKFKDVTGHEPHPFLKRGVFFRKEILPKSWGCTNMVNRSFYIRVEDLLQIRCI